MKIFITGATGFIGQHLTASLLEKGHEVVGWGPHPEKLAPCDRLILKKGDLADASSEAERDLQAAMAGAEAVVHLAAKTSERAADPKAMSSVNAKGTERLLASAKKNKVKKFVLVSSQSTKVSKPGNYGATKKEAEQAVLASGLDAVILRPAIVYGPGSAGLFKKFVELVRKFPVIPVPQTNTTFQPVFVSDVVDAIVKALESGGGRTSIYDVAGPDVVTFSGLIRQVAKAQGLVRFLIPIPLGLMMMAARILSKITSNPPVTPDNLIGLTEVTSIDLNPLKRDLHVDPLGLKEGLQKTFGVAQ